MEKLEKAFIKKVITIYLQTQIGDKWMNKDEYEFSETRDGKLIIEEKE